jgi:hypothetical protein
MRRTVPLLLALAFVAGCGPARIDGSSGESFQASYEQVRGSLEEDERERFEDAIRAIGIADLARFSEDDDSDAAERSIMAHLDGKSAEEIILEAEALKD